MNTYRTRSLVCVLVVGLLASTAGAAVNIQTVPVGSPGNAADPNTGSLYGSVAYTYNIVKYEVTAGQYTEFLNAVAKTEDTYGLYDPRMSTDINYGCRIQQTGTPGNWSYSVAGDYANRPVNYVSFWDATRFANWLHNGQGSGDTETGAYTLTAGGISGNTITRNAGWQWAVTSEDEWYKAAYHQPAAQGGDLDNYWSYPTSSNTISTSQANYNNANTTPVGSYAANFYGTFDMGGNVWEWNEAVIPGSYRGLRGGAFYSINFNFLHAANRRIVDPTYEDYGIGFRVSEVPEPTSMAILALGGIGMLIRRRAGAWRLN